MPIQQRQHIRFSLDLPAVRCAKFGEKTDISLLQISVGGCLFEWDDNIFAGDELRIEVHLPNQNRLPLKCKVIYRFENQGIGAKFSEVTRFEQELIASVIINALAEAGLPMQVDPFAVPHAAQKNTEPQMFDARREKEEILEKVMSTEREVQT